MAGTVILTTDPSGSFEWMMFLMNKYSTLFIEGTIVTLYVAVTGTIAGFLLGYLLGIIQDLEANPGDLAIKRFMLFIIKGICILFVEVFRGTPMIVQGMIIYYGLLQAGINIASVTAGVLVTILNTGAYMSETVRAGIKSIDTGQKEGALAIGMSPLKTMLIIILPQALRNILPEMTNTFLTNLKMTSVLNVIGVSELFMMAKTAGGTYYKYYEAYLVIALIYLVLCFVFNRVFLLLEKRMSQKKDYALAVEYMDSE